MIRPLVNLLFPLLLFACAQPQPELQETNIPFTVLGQGQDSGITLQKFLIIQTPEEFAELWLVHDRGRHPLPKVDFTTHKVLGIFLGQQYTGGYAVAVSKIESTEQQTNVHVLFKSPAPNAQLSMALTQPYVLIALPQDTHKINYQVTQIQ